MIVHCKLPNNTEFLCYSSANNITFPSEMQIEIISEITEDIFLNKKFHQFPIFQFEQIQARMIFSKVRIPDIRLEEEGIITLNDLINAYFLLRHKQLNKSLRIRELVEQKYIDIQNSISESLAENGSRNEDAAATAGFNPEQ